ncbi:MAG: methylamine utilization protein [Pseudomonadota bacterium]
MKLPLRPLVFACMFAACLDAGATGVAVVVHDAAGKPLADTVVYVEGEGAAAPPKVQKSGEIEQKGLKFIPLVSVVQTGSKVSFPNNDKVRHHIYSFSPAHKFDQKLYSGVAAVPQVFERAGTVVLGCNIHDKMIAYVKVVDTPYFAKTDASGVAHIELPAGGKYTVKAWHYNMTASANGEQTAQVKAGDVQTPLTFALAMKPPSVDADSPAADPRY